VGSSWFHQKKVGDSVLAMSPSGHFYDEPGGNNPRIYIAGGVGITPLLSMIHKNISDQVQFPIHLFYAARTENDLAFHNIFIDYAKKFSNFKYQWYLSDTPEAEKRILNLKAIKTEISNLQIGKFFLCGPAPLTDGIINDLKNAQVSEESIFNEKFISPTSLNPDTLPVRQLNLKYAGKTLKYNGRDNVLLFLENNGESLPYACRTGVCGSCRCKIKGQFTVLTDSGLSRDEKREGYSLACVAFPEGDVEVEA
jgi:NADH oxidoreductase Hcr